MMYTQDYDERFPMAFGWDKSARVWGYGDLHFVLSSESTAWTSAIGPITRAKSAGIRANSVQPYIKNLDLYGCPSSSDLTPSYIPASINAGQVSQPAPMSYMFNGLLHTYGEAGVIQPADTIMLWEGDGKVRLHGFTYAAPYLVCPEASTTDDPVPCQYVPASGSCDASKNGQTSSSYLSDATNWVHNKGMNMVFADGHVKYRMVGGRTNASAAEAQSNPAPTDCKTDPGLGYDPSGLPWWFYNVAGPNGEQWTCHTYLFRPDYQPSDTCW